ncbi:hypothetical protein [Erythrobacter litoralis]|uniref:Uncharacterized protein n=1 Tax=Erythrobacter litoralis (strain HTCC2594) TaxID=314225 RepID=Q2NCN5_ERYLH|nr:hypothetical protein [Erythrobacter litoralis]ABC62556.1 hypothetical protein ELI_02320 [Erythrobacter litoralis HTCC2594]
MPDGPAPKLEAAESAAPADDSFRDALDRLSRKVDADNFERMRWGRDEAPKLVRLVQLVKGAVDDRSDIDINEEGGEGNTKRFVVKVHGQRVAALAIALDKGRAIASIGTIERSDFTVAKGDPVHTRYENVDEAWIATALASLMERIGG